MPMHDWTRVPAGIFQAFHHHETTAIGQPLPDMPLFLEPEGCVMVPLETTYESAFATLPLRWRGILVK